MRTAVISLGDHRDTDDTSLPIRTPVERRSVLTWSADPCSVLSAHVHRVSLVHEVRPALAVANEGSDEGGAALPDLVQIVEHRVAPCERPGCLTHQREEI